jgi:hypothetical protein
VVERALGRLVPGGPGGARGGCGVGEGPVLVLDDPAQDIFKALSWVSTLRGVCVCAWEARVWMWCGVVQCAAEQSRVERSAAQRSAIPRQQSRAEQRKAPHRMVQYSTT